MERTGYVVLCHGGKFLGSRRFSHKEGTTRAISTQFETARIFNRKQDAVAAAGRRGDVVGEVRITLCEHS